MYISARKSRLLKNVTTCFCFIYFTNLFYKARHTSSAPLYRALKIPDVKSPLIPFNILGHPPMYWDAHAEVVLEHHLLHYTETHI